MVRKVLGIALAFAVAAADAAEPKYVFLFIGDGMSTPQRMVSEEFSRAIGRGPLAMNQLPYQSMTRTRSANALVTDSAAAATAIACGEKANNGALGVAPDGRRLESVAEVAHKKGMKVGIMTTVTIVHATPAAFFAHVPSRGEYYRIALDLVNSGFEYFAASGVYNKYDDKTCPAYCGNIFDFGAKRGYTLVRDKAALQALKPGVGKVWGVFGEDGLEFAIDHAPDQPSLADMVAKGIELLSNPNGFFIMAEGGKVDYSAHANDAATTAREILAMDDAVRVASAFARKHPEETLIIVTGDHETGGMTMGFAGIGYNFNVELLARQKISSEIFSRHLVAKLQENPNLAFEDLLPVIRENFGLIANRAEAKTEEDRKLVLSKAEIKELRAAFDFDVKFVRSNEKETRKHDEERRLRFSSTAKRLLDQHAGIGWTSGAHTAMPTMTTAAGVCADQFIGYLENVDISRKLKALLTTSH